MPLLLVPLLLLVALAAIPFSIVQRYRVGTSRQRARGWLTAINVVGLSISAVFFLAGAAITSLWVPRALPYSVIGFVSGLALGIVGLLLTRWERTPQGLHFTPNRPLVFVLTVVVTLRIGYGLWHTIHAWRSGADPTGIAGSLAAGAVVLGYYLSYWLGVRRRMRRGT